MRIYLQVLFYLFCSYGANAAYPQRPIDFCSALLSDQNTFARQLTEKFGVEDYMAEALDEFRVHPMIAKIDPARLLVLKSVDFEPPVLWVFPEHTTAAQGLRDGMNDRHGTISERVHKFVAPLEYSRQSLGDKNPVGRLVRIPGMLSNAFLTSDGRSIHPNMNHVSFDYLNVYRWQLTSKQTILAFGKLIDRAEPALRNIYNRNYYYLLSELLIDDRLLEVLDPANVVTLRAHGRTYFVFLGIRANPLFGFLWHSHVWASLLGDADTGNLVELNSFYKSGDTLKLTPSGREKLITFLADRARRRPEQARVDLENVNADTDIFILQQKLFPANGLYQNFLRILQDDGQTFAN